MEKIKNDHYKKLVEEIAEKHGVELSQAREVRDSMFSFIRKEIGKIDYTGVDTEEEFDKIKKNFNIPKLGKLYANYYNLKSIKKKNNVRKNRRQDQERREC